MKKLIKYLLICNITIILFVILNILISYLWIFYNNFKYESKNPFSKEVRKSFTLSNSDQSILHKNTYDLKYEYAPYLGAVPKNYKSKFVNYDKETGRYISNAEPCVNKIFFFGGSTTFGWLNEDNNTMPSIFKKILKDDLKQNCVFNFGSPYFFSKQENIYLLNLIENNNKPTHAIFLDGVNEICNGYEYSEIFKQNFSEINVDHRTLIFNKKLITIIKSLPMYQLADRLSVNKISSSNEKSYCNKNESLSNIFFLRLQYRESLCTLFEIECYTFLQPFGGIHGNIHPVSKNFKEKMLIRYNELKNSIAVFNSKNKNLQMITKDISYILKNDDKKIHYVDNLHYSTHANTIIAKEILKVFNENKK